MTVDATSWFNTGYEDDEFYAESQLLPDITKMQLSQSIEVIWFSLLVLYFDDWHYRQIFNIVYVVDWLSALRIIMIVHLCCCLTKALLTRFNFVVNELIVIARAFFYVFAKKLLVVPFAKTQINTASLHN